VVLLSRLQRALLWWGFRTLCRGVAALGRLLYGLEVRGMEHLPAQGPWLFLGRRISRIDFIGAAFLLSDRGIYKALRQGELSGLTGLMVICNSRWLAWAGQELGILSAVKGKSLSVGALWKAYHLLRQGRIIVNADEGEVPWDGRLQPLRSGVAWLALRTHAPVVIGMLQGGYDIWPRWASRPRLTGKLILKIGKPFYLCEGCCDRITEEMLQEANQRILAALQGLSEGYMSPKRNIS
jgi:1-acyl-sn-glycerol-3-phosphate acyltransferase